MTRYINILVPTLGPFCASQCLVRMPRRLMLANATKERKTMERYYKSSSSSSFQPSASYIEASTSSLGAAENASEPVTLDVVPMDFVGVAAMVGAIRLGLGGGELSVGLAGVSNTCDGAVNPTSENGSTTFEGVVKIVLRAAPERKVLVFGALQGVSAIFGCTRPRPAATLR